jgi:endonuclease YncB( thermonuclease family)
VRHALLACCPCFPVGRWRALLASCVVLAAGIGQAGETIAPFKGVPRIEDVDTFQVGRATIRLNGVDGPETHGTAEAAGKAATRFLRELTGGQTVTCTWNGDMTYGRFVAVCTFPDGRDLGDTIIRAGYGQDCRHFSGGRYAAAEKEAATAKRGLWATGAMPPRAIYC